jgi:transcriptional regulator with XRE-family HTH domain
VSSHDPVPPQELGRTLAEFAELSGLSAPFLSQIENDRAKPSMRSLQRMADALDTTAVQLLASAERSGHVDVVRATEGAPLAAAEDDPTGAVRTLVRGTRQLHALEFTGGLDHGDREFVHRNDELLYVICGSARATAGGAVYDLTEGDTLYCTGGVRHSWRPLSNDTKVLLVAIADNARVGMRVGPCNRTTGASTGRWSTASPSSPTAPSWPDVVKSTRTAISCASAATRGHTTTRTTSATAGSFTPQ